MKRPLFYIGALLAASSLSAAPRITKVYNGASFAEPGLANANLAQGSIFTVKGTELGPAQIAFPPGRFETTLAGTAVKFTPVSGGAGFDGFLIHSLATQVSGIVPSIAPVGEYNVTVTYNGQTSPAARATIVRSSFGIFTRDSSGSGVAVVQNHYAEGARYNGMTETLEEGQAAIIWGTGLGAVNIGDNLPPAAGNIVDINNEIVVLVNNIEVKPFYAGRAPGFSGLDQVNFNMPAGVPDSCYVNLAVRVRGVTSKSTTISKKTGHGVCPHPLQLTESTLRRLDAGGELTVGTLSLGATSTSISLAGTTFTLNSEDAYGGFTRYNLSSLVAFSGQLPNVQNIGSCTVITFSLTIDPNNPTPAIPLPTSLDAGARLVLTGAGKTKDLPRANGVYSASLYSSGIPIPGAPAGGSPFLQEGQWTFTGSGGADVGAFTASVNLATPLVWTNRDSINEIVRSTPLRVTWTGGGNAQSDLVTISGGAFLLTPGSQTSGTSTTFVCTAPATAREFTVPTSVLAGIPPVGSSLESGSGILTVGSSVNRPFNAPLTAGGQIDLGVISATSGSTKTVSVR